jgi:hypothetical protein
LKVIRYGMRVAGGAVRWGEASKARMILGAGFRGLDVRRMKAMPC